MCDDNQPGKLLAATIALYKNRPRDVTAASLADQIGTSANYVSMLLTGRVDNPSVNKIEKLYELLSGKTLQL